MVGQVVGQGDGEVARDDRVLGGPIGGDAIARLEDAVEAGELDHDAHDAFLTDPHALAALTDWSA